MKKIALLIFSLFTFSCAASNPIHTTKYRPSIYLSSFEMLMRNQLKSSIKRFLTKHGEPEITYAEDLILWCVSAYLLHTLACKKITRYIVTPALAFDALLAYSHYPSYKALGSYPSFDLIGFPSMTLSCTHLLRMLWKTVRGKGEQIFFGKHKNIMHIAQAANRREITSDDIEDLTDHFNQFKHELYERGLLKYLHLAGEQVQETFQELQELVESPHTQDYVVVYKMLQLARALKRFVQRG